jgi:nitrogen fixation protein FixH
MTFKWNWGTGIIFVYTGFVVFMLGMVYLCTRQHFDLVTQDYYEQELQYQQVIDGTVNERALEKQTKVEIGKEMVTVTLPMEKIDGEGKVLFYKPDNAKFDVNLPFEGKTEISIPLSQLAKGIYKVKASWQHNGKPYFNEQSIYIQ